MSILIPGMEMPKRCKGCQFAGFGGIRSELSVCMFTGESQSILSHERMSKCPLIHVPPHGRLIDADKLDYSKTDLLGDHIVYMVDIEDTPTIIPASGGSKNE